MNFTMCAVSSCNQRACFQAGDELLCGDHWKAALERTQLDDEKQELLRLASEAISDSDIREVLRRLIERSFE